MRSQQEQLSELDAVDLIAAAAPEQAVEIIAEALQSDNDLVSSLAADKLEQLAAKLGEAALPAIRAAFESTEDRMHGPASDGAKALGKLSDLPNYFDIAEEIVADWLTRAHTYGGHVMYTGEEPGHMSYVVSSGPYFLQEPEVIQHAICQPLQARWHSDPSWVMEAEDRFLENQHSFMRRAFIRLLPEIAGNEAARDFAVGKWRVALASDRNSVVWVAKGLMGSMLAVAPSQVWPLVEEFAHGVDQRHTPYVVHALLTQGDDSRVGQLLPVVISATRDPEVLEQVNKWIAERASDHPETCDLLRQIWPRLLDLRGEDSMYLWANDYIGALHACAPVAPHVVLELVRDGVARFGGELASEAARIATELPAGRDQDALDLLSTIAANEDPVVRGAAADALGDKRFTFAHVIDLLSELAQDASPDAQFDPFEGYHPRPTDDDYSHPIMGPRTVREFVALSVGNVVIRDPDCEQAWDVLAQLAQDRHWIVRYWAAYCFVRLAQADRGRDRLLQIARERTDAEDHPRVNYMLGNLWASLWGRLAPASQDEADQRVASIVIGGEPGIRVALAELVAHGGLVSDGLRPVLNELLQDENTEVRRRIAWKLTHLAREKSTPNRQDALDMLKELAADADGEVRSAALLVLHDIEPDMVQDVAPIVGAYLDHTEALDVAGRRGLDAYGLAEFLQAVSRDWPDQTIGWATKLLDLTGPVRISGIGQALVNAHAASTDADMKSRAFEAVERLADEWGEPFVAMLQRLRGDTPPEE